MRGIRTCLLPGMIIGFTLLSGAAGAAQQDKEANVVRVNGIRNPETHTYRAIVAGLDAFDAQHALAPKVPQLLFQATNRSGAQLDAAVLQGAPGTGRLGARLSGDGDYTLTLALDEAGRFQVPRSQPAWDAEAELRLSGKHSEIRVWPWVRTPGLAGNQRRLGDIRLECQVFVAIAKKEAPLHIVLLGNTFMMGSDWCAFMKDKENTWDVAMPGKLSAAVLHDGARSLALRVSGRKFAVPIGDTSWSNDAIVDLEFAPTELRNAEPAPAP